MIRYHARHVVPVAAAPIANGTVAVEGARIAYVGPRTGAPPGEDRDLGNAMILPGLVNAHCHLELTAMRGFLEGLDFRRWILRLTTAKREVLTRELLLDAARYGIAEGLRAGITSYGDTCDSGVAFDAMHDMGVRGVMYQEVFGPDPAQCAGALAELRAKVGTLRPRATTRIRLGVSPHAPYTVSDDLFAAVARYARDESLPMAVHIAESEVEDELVVRGAGAFADGLRKRGIAVAPRAASPVALLQSLGVLAARPLLIHCVRVAAADVAAIAGARCAVAHCPASNAKLGHGIAPLATMQRAGVDIGLGSDSMASNNRMSILDEARLAVLFQRALRADHDAITAAEALALATVGGARALGIDADVGTLEPGKAADLAAFPLVTAAPTFDPVDAAIFALGGTPASLVVVDGEERVRNGKVLHDDRPYAASVEHSRELLDEWLRRAAPRELR